MPAEAEGSGSPDAEEAIHSMLRQGEQHIHSPESSDESTAPRMAAGVEEYSEEADAAAAADRELLEEPFSPAIEEAVDIRNDVAQKNFDQQVISVTIRMLRESLANAKVNYQLAKRGLVVVPQGVRAPHPEQIRGEIKKIRQQLAWLIEASLSDTEIEYPSDLEVASELPKQGEAQKLGLA